MVEYFFGIDVTTSFSWDTKAAVTGMGLELCDSQSRQFSVTSSLSLGLVTGALINLIVSVVLLGKIVSLIGKDLS